MNRTLLNSSLLLVLTSVISGCGSDEGFGYQLDSTEPVTMEATVNIALAETLPANSDRYVTINLLDGVTSQNVDLGTSPGNILIQDSSFEVSVAPIDKDLTFENTANPVVISGFNLIVDTAAFEDQLTTGETANYSVSYWINNGYLFTCADMTKHPANCTDEERANNPNRRTLNIAIGALDDPLIAIELADISVGLDETIATDIIFTPSFAADPGFIYEVISGQNNISVTTDGLITGLALGMSELTVTSIGNSALTKTAVVTVTNPPKNVASFSLTTPAGDAIGADIEIPECTSFDLVTQLSKVDDTLPLAGDFVYNLASQNGAFDIDGFTANSGPIQGGFLSVITLDASDSLTASLSGFGTNNDIVTANITTVDNLACNFADLSPVGPNLLNEEFTVYYNNGNGSIDAFRKSAFIRNGVGDDANLDPSATVQIDATNGKNGGAAIRVTGDGSLPAAFYSYHRNTARALSVAFIDGGLFKISFWVKNNTDASVELSNEVVAGDGRGAGAPVAGQFSDTPVSETVTIPASTDWKRVEFNIDFPAVTSDQNVPKWEIIISPSQANAIDILFDDFAITSGS